MNSIFIRVLLFTKQKNALRELPILARMTWSLRPSRRYPKHLENPDLKFGGSAPLLISSSRPWIRLLAFLFLAVSKGVGSLATPFGRALALQLWTGRSLLVILQHLERLMERLVVWGMGSSALCKLSVLRYVDLKNWQVATGAARAGE